MRVERLVTIRRTKDAQLSTLIFQLLLLVQSQVNLHGNADGGTHHRVVADAEEAHHLNVGGNARRTGELSVAVHAAQRVGHTVAGGTCSHVVGVQGATRTTTTGH